jgi:hypothetical protein
MKKLYYAGLSYALPFLAAAQTIPTPNTTGTTGTNSTPNPLKNLVLDLIKFIDGYLVPLAFALALIMFLFGVFRFFFAGTSDEKRQEGRKFIMWGIVALAIMVAVWGLVNLLLNTFNLGNESRPCLPTFQGACNRNGVTGG